MAFSIIDIIIKYIKILFDFENFFIFIFLVNIIETVNKLINKSKNLITGIIFIC